MICGANGWFAGWTKVCCIIIIMEKCLLYRAHESDERLVRVSTSLGLYWRNNREKIYFSIKWLFNCVAHISHIWFWTSTFCCFCTTQGNLTVANINRNPTNCYWIHCNNDAIYMKNKTIKIKTIFLKLCAHDVTLRRIIPANHGLSGAQKERNWMMGGNTFWLRAGRGVWNHRRYTTDAVLLSSLILWLRNRIKNYFRGLIKIQMEILYHSNTTLVYTLRESCHSLFILILTFCCASCMY